MSLTLIVWSGLFLLLLVLAFKRPVWGVSLYMLTFFACPPLWWWGRSLAGYRWSFYGGMALLVAVLVSRLMNVEGDRKPDSPEVRRLIWIVLAILANATLVHLLLADHAEISAERYYLLAKFVLLFLMIVAAVRTPADLRIVLLSIVIGAAYIGYEVTVNDRGHMSGTRLEGVGVPSASDANGLACLMVTILPMAGAFFLVGCRWEKILMLFSAPMILNVIITCNSRGAFLALIAGTVVFLVSAPAHTRKKVLKLTCLGAVAAWLLLGDPRIVDRFMTTFASDEERDTSAAGRLDYWKAGMRMMADHPLGEGGNGFHDVYGPKYLARQGIYYEARSVHNGYINEACDWGLQGLALRLALMGGCLLLLRRAALSTVARGDDFDALIASALIAGITGFLVQSVFDDFLDNEWGYWMAACALVHVRFCQAADEEHEEQPAWEEPDTWPSPPRASAEHQLVLR